MKRALKVRNIVGSYSALSELHGPLRLQPGATRLALLGACPWLSYFAPSALPDYKTLRPWCCVDYKTLRPWCCVDSIQTPEASRHKLRGLNAGRLAITFVEGPGLFKTSGRTRYRTVIFVYPLVVLNHFVNQS